MVLEQTAPLRVGDSRRSWETEVFVVRAQDRSRLLQRVGTLADYLDGHPEVELVDLAFSLNTESERGEERLAIVAGSVGDLSARLGRAARRLSDSRCRRINDTQGIYYFEDPLYEPGRLALLFPGEGAQYPNMLGDLLPHFPEVADHFQNCDQISLRAGKRTEPISRSVFRPVDTPAARETAEKELARLDNAPASVLIANWGLHRLLAGLGLKGDVVAGHSSGEISALAAAGCIDADDHLFAELFALGYLLQQEEDEGRMADAALLAVATGCRQMTEVIDEHHLEAHLAMDNCPHQTVVGGTRSAVAAIQRRMRDAGVLCERLPFSRAYHTILFQPHLGPFARMYDAITVRPPRLPVYCCVTGKRFPDDPSEIRHLAVLHWASRVEFTRLIETMYEDGIRLFVESGPRGNLTSFVQDILRGQQFVAVASDLHWRSGISQINHLAGELTAHHVPLELGCLYRRRDPRPVDWESTTQRVAAERSVGWDKVPPSTSHVGRDKVPPHTSTKDRRWDFVPPYNHHAYNHDPQREAVLAGYFRVMGDFLSVQQEVHQEFLGMIHRNHARKSANGRSDAVAASASRQPMIGEIVRHEPGHFLVMRRRMDLDEDRYARDHTLGGRNASAIDTDHHGLAVMPMALNLEMMAEVASLLVPGKLIVGLKRVRLQRWIPLHEEPITLEVTAQLVQPDARSGNGNTAGTNEVALTIHNLGNASQPGQADSPAVEGTVVLGDRYPSPPEVDGFPLTGQRSCRLGPDELYRTECRLFHGPSFQAVCSTDRMGEEGIEGHLTTLSHAGLFSSTADPKLLLDPLLIDASTHILGCWHFSLPDQTGRVVFPYELGSVQLFGPRPAEGTRIKCRVAIEQSSARQVSHRIDLITPEGRLWCRLDPAEYWRFYWPPEYVAFFRHHEQYLICKDWPAALPGPVADRGGQADQQVFPAACCMRVDPPADIVQPVIRAALAHVALSRAEWQEFYRMRGPEHRRTEWLFGRIAAKDCIRALWQEKHSQRLFPADLEIDTDPHGRPLARHCTVAAEDLPRISITHSDGVIAALAAFGRRVGIDLERIKSRGTRFEEIAFDQRERELLDQFGQDRNEGIARLWCAKEAVAKALGRGLLEGPRSLAGRRIDVDTGTIHLELGPGLASLFPELQSSLIVAWTKKGAKKGVRNLLRRAPEGPSGQKVPDTFFVVATTFAEVEETA